MKQDDDLLHNYTVAKITMDCEFNKLQSPPKQPYIKTYETTEYQTKYDESEMLYTMNLEMKFKS